MKRVEVRCVSRHFLDLDWKHAQRNMSHGRKVLALFVGRLRKHPAFSVKDGMGSVLKHIKHPPRLPSLARTKNSLRKIRLSITLDASIVAALDERGHPRGEQIRQDLRRYYRLLTEGRFALRAKLSTENLSLILDACNGWTMDPEAPRHLWIQVADGIRLKGLDTKWAVADSPGLLRRLQELTWLESLALADAVERFWQAKRKGDRMSDPSRALE